MPYDGQSTVTEGLPYPRGASWNGNGVNFSLFSAHATKVELCLFDRDGTTEQHRLTLPEYTDEVWHGYVPGTLIRAHQYGYRVHGPYEPSAKATGSIPTSWCSIPMRAHIQANSSGTRRVSDTSSVPTTPT